MTHLIANYSNKGQLKIQEMAFVLVAIILFFAIAGLIVLKFSFSSFQNSVIDQRAEQANEMVRMIASSPEFALTLSGQPYCDSCVDMDKVLELKEIKDYKNFWGLDNLTVEVVYPNQTGECNKDNYPNCKSITLVSNVGAGAPSSAFVSLCRIEDKGGIFYKCVLGRIIAAGKNINE